MLQNILEYIPLLFDRPSEPLITGRDDVSFQIPHTLLPDRYQSIAPSMHSKFPTRGKVVNVEKIDPPDLSEITKLQRHDDFSLFNAEHRRSASKLTEILLEMPDVNSFFSACVYARERVNPRLFVYAASVAIIHRKDTKNITLPSNAEVFPDQYIYNSVFAEAREEVGVYPDGCRIPIEIPHDFTATDLDHEHRVAYFREDVGINLHHWHWHLVYPAEGRELIVKKDRRGELFYYMHQQIIARYNFERLSNKLARVRRLNNFNEPIPEGYYPKLNDFIASRDWPARQANSVMKDVYRECDGVRLYIKELERWADRILNDICDRTVIDSEGKNVPLTEHDGIDILGNIIEASTLSINRQRYGDLHNSGHLLLAYIHDPDSKYLENMGIMGDNATTMRDPVFYAWHAYIDDLLDEFKRTLTPYTEKELVFDDIIIRGVKIIAENNRVNEFSTYWQQDDINLSRGLDFQPRGSVYARITHLQHASFKYHIQVLNNGEERSGTVRIFMAPKHDERHKNILLRDQRKLFIELDKFTFNLLPGMNLIERDSIESSVTIPFEQTFRSQDQFSSGLSIEDFNFCGCGWPQHMLIPKGTAEGLPAELFVMITDAKQDLVKQPDSACRKPKFDDAQSYCGVQGGLYPDKRAMGFPFDRLPRPDVNKLIDFLTPNMFVQPTVIKFTNTFVPSPHRKSDQNSTPCVQNKYLEAAEQLTLM